MVSNQVIADNLAHCITEIDLDSKFGKHVSGKVRECYLQEGTRVLIATDRLSAFDRILTSIPFKGSLLTQLAIHWFKQTEGLIQNHIISNPHPSVMFVKEVEILPVEVIIRGYITGSAWRDYGNGKAISGIRLPEGLQKSQQLPEPILTPSTKAEMGLHDEPISCEEILKQGLVEESIWNEVSQKAQELYAFGVKKAAEQDLILVDTKYEFGLITDENGKKQVVLADEVHTQDSSRFWIKSSYDERFSQGEDPIMLDKEFVRRELMNRGYMGEGEAPTLEDEFRVKTATKYIEAFERITGKDFVPETGDQKDAIIAAIEGCLG